jgi:hypothetical protein
MSLVRDLFKRSRNFFRYRNGWRGLPNETSRELRLFFSDASRVRA